MNKIILWDWDNTLVDSFDAVYKAHVDLRTRYGLVPMDKAGVKEMMNHSSRDYFPKNFGDNAWQANDFFQKAYLKYSTDIQFKPGAIEALKTAKGLGFANVIASNKNGLMLRNEVKRLGVEALTRRVIGAGDAPQDKPAKAFMDMAIEGLDATQVLCIGDGASDMRLAATEPFVTAILVWSDPTSDEFKGLKIDKSFGTLADVSAFLKGK